MFFTISLLFLVLGSGLLAAGYGIFFYSGLEDFEFLKEYRLQDEI